MESSAEKLPFLEPRPYEDDDELNDNDLQDGTPPSSRYRRQCQLGVLVIASSIVSAIVGSLAGSWWVLGRSNELCISHTSRQSPLTNDISISYHTVRFNGSLLKENVYRQKAGPQVDAAWDALGVNYHSVIVPEEDAERVGFAADQVQVGQKYGGGYPASVEGLHQLHCLNLVRQALFYNYDFYHAQGEGAFKNDDYILQKHVSHCLDIVRQQLMCTVDIGMVGQVWFQPSTSQYPEAYVDFNTQHVCRNFEDVRKWAEDHQIPTEVPGDILEPPKAGGTVYHTIP